VTVPARAHIRARARLGALARAALTSQSTFVLFLCAALFVVLWCYDPRVAGSRNLANIASNMWPLFVLALGQMCVLLVAGIDLSQTTIMAFASVVGAAVMTSGVNPELFAKSPLWGWCLSAQGGLLAGSVFAVPAAALVMGAVGAFAGCLNGLCVARLAMPPFMVTLVAMIFLEGFAVYLTRSENIMDLPGAFVAIGKGGVGIATWALLVAVVTGIAAYVVLTRTVLGKWIYATGRNPRAAAISGVPVARVTVLAYTLSGLCAALAAILYSARLEAGRPTLGKNLLLDVIGAVVIGGVSLFGGKGTVLGALLGVLFFALLANALSIFNLSFYMTDIVKGGVILLAATLDIARTRFPQHGRFFGERR
jgi:ribose/xylose/arabinose/galactoside ABC-type transport system permease subunit